MTNIRKELSNILSLAIAAMPFLATASIASDGCIVFTRVNVIPMTKDTILLRQDVIVRGEFIEAVLPEGSASIPSNARIIDAHGGYLMPGIADMHTHLSIYDRDPRHLAIYLAQGVTTARSFSGTPTDLEWRAAVREGRLLGPTIYTTGRIVAGMHHQHGAFASLYRKFQALLFVAPLALVLVLLGIVRIMRPFAFARVAALLALIALAAGAIIVKFHLVPFMITERFWSAHDSYIVERPSQAIRAVRELKEKGYDFVKVYDFLNENLYLTTVKEAKSLGMFVSGHLPDEVPLQTIARSGQDETAHVDELISYLWVGYDAREGHASAIKRALSFDESLIPQVAGLLAENKIAAVSTLAEHEMRIRLLKDTESVLAGHEYRLVRPAGKEFVARVGRNVASWKGQEEYRERVMHPILLKLVRALSDAGVTITVGSAATNEGMIPAYHCHREIEILVEAGLTPFEALRAATASAGEVALRMGENERFGVIEPGARADLLLLEENPLEDVSRTRRRVGVMARGVYRTQAELDSIVNEFISSYK